MKPILSQRNRRSIINSKTSDSKFVPSQKMHSGKHETCKEVAPSFMQLSELSVSTLTAESSFEYQQANQVRYPRQPIRKGQTDFSEHYGFESQDLFSTFLPISSIKKGLEQIYDQVKNHNTYETQEIKQWINRVTEPNHKLSFDEILALDQIFMRFSKNIDTNDTFTVTGYSVK